MHLVDLQSFRVVQWCRVGVWECETVGLWECKRVGVWECGIVRVWEWCCVGMLCGSVSALECGSENIKQDMCTQVNNSSTTWIRIWSKTLELGTEWKALRHELYLHNWQIYSELYSPKYPLKMRCNLMAAGLSTRSINRKLIICWNLFRCINPRTTDCICSTALGTRTSTCKIPCHK